MIRLLTIAAVFLLVSCEQSSWNEEEQEAFMDECLSEMEDKTYCECYMKKVMEQYPQAEEAEEMSFEEAYEFSKACQE